MKDELQKAQKLAERGLASNYLLLTNATITGDADLKLREAFESLPGLNRFLSFGTDWISRTIVENPRLRALVPRVYGLGDLSQILDQRAYRQAQEILESLGPELAKFVVTEPYRRSVDALNDHRFVLLLGEPACGKSTIASALSLVAVDQSGCRLVKVRDAEDFQTHWNPDDSLQFFWVDDAFGSNQLDLALLNEWNQVFGHVTAALKRGARFVFTSRDYIFRAAKDHIRTAALPVIMESQVVIEVERLTAAEREQILYNHLKMGGQPTEFRRRVKPWLSKVASHPGFLPETARRLGTPLFTKSLILYEGGVLDFVARPVHWLREVIAGLHGAHKAALAVVFMRGGKLNDQMDLAATEERAIELFGANVGQTREALAALNGTLLTYGKEGGRGFWKFKHPTVRDAMGDIVADDPALADIYLAGAPLKAVLNEVTCGDVGVENVKLLVESNRFEVVIRRLSEFELSRHSDLAAISGFLNSRCTLEFVQAFINANPSFASELSGFFSPLAYDVKVRLILRLHKFGLLPEEVRSAFVGKAIELSIGIPDDSLLCDDELLALLKSEEKETLLGSIEAHVIQTAEQVVENWQSNYDKSEDADEYFRPLRKAFTTYKDFVGEEQALKCEEAIESIDQLILSYENEGGNEPDDIRADDEGAGPVPGDRSVFDDVDS